LIGFFLLGAIATTGILDIYSYSQTRYYLPLSTLALFWTYAVLIQEYSVKQRKFWSVLLLLFILLPDVYLGARRKDGPFPPFQGLQVIYHDFQTGFLKTQGLHQAFEEISKDPQKHPVLVDYVPQFANWYVPGFPIALMPDATSKTKLNSENPIWNQDRSAFFWHVAYLDLPMRLWNCSNHCDYQIENLNLEAKTYELRIHSQQKSIAMCIVKRWKSTLWVNAPFRLLTPSAFEATGNGENLLGLSRPCHAD
jgi:hypothetical protein